MLFETVCLPVGRNYSDTFLLVGRFKKEILMLVDSEFSFHSFCIHLVFIFLLVTEKYLLVAM